MGRQSVPVQMRWADLDAYGHVNNAAMLTLLEEARIAVFWTSETGEAPGRADGAPGPAEEPRTSAKVLPGGPGSDTHTLVARQEIEYLAPLPYSQDPVEIQLWIGEIGGASLLVCYEVLTATGQTCARAATSIVKVSAETGHPVRFTAEERQALVPLLDDPVEFRRR